MPTFSLFRNLLFRKSDNWRQIYKQTSSTFDTLSDVSKTYWEEKIIIST